MHNIIIVYGLIIIVYRFVINKNNTLLMMIKTLEPTKCTDAQIQYLFLVKKLYKI